MKTKIILALCLMATLVVLWACSRPAMMPARHLNDEPKSPMAPTTTEQCKSAPLLFADPKDKIIREQEELLRLYEKRIAELEKMMRETKKESK